MTKAATPVIACVVCGSDKEVRNSLRLSRDARGNWISNPVCANCRMSLIRDAKIAGKFIPFFGLEASSKEAAKRNDQAKINRPFLEKFGRVRESAKPKPKKAKVIPLKKATKRPG